MQHSTCVQHLHSNPDLQLPDTFSFTTLQCSGVDYIVGPLLTKLYTLKWRPARVTESIEISSVANSAENKRAKLGDETALPKLFFWQWPPQCTPQWSFLLLFGQKWNCWAEWKIPVTETHDNILVTCSKNSVTARFCEPVLSIQCTGKLAPPGIHPQEINKCVVCVTSGNDVTKMLDCLSHKFTQLMIFLCILPCAHRARISLGSSGLQA